MKKPSRLRPGDTIGIVAPSSPVPADELKKGVALIEARGYKVEIGPNVLATVQHCDYLAGKDRQRAGDMNRFFAREDIKAVFCARGGYGSMRLFDLLDWNIILVHPKIFVGYSDITSLHTVFARAEHVTIHSTMVSSLHKLNEWTTYMFWEMLEDTEPYGLLPTEGSEIQTIVPGRVAGRLTGGNLCLLAQACGSRFSPDFSRKIVLLEDINESVYHTDRDLIQLRNAGQLDKAAGFIIGTLTGWEKHEADPPQNSPTALWKEIFEPMGKPTIAGFPFGHEPNPLPIPLGVMATLDANAQTLELLESAVN